MNVAVTGSAKAVASARTATAWTAWTKKATGGLPLQEAQTRCVDRAGPQLKWHDAE
jgi:hypothetical protein